MKNSQQGKMKKDQNPVAQFLTCTSLFARQRKAAADKRRCETLKAAHNLLCQK
jgi:hypothetical protein